MFFQINITPKEKKAAEHSLQAQVNNSYSLLLAPFQPPTRIKLDTHVNSSVECKLTIRNSNNRHLTVSVVKVPPEERCINLSATQWSVEPDSSIDLNITWKPVEEGSWRDILQLSDSRRIKYDVPLILNSTNPNKGMKKNKALGKANKSNLFSKATTTKSILKDDKLAVIKTKRPRATQVADKENKCQNVGPNWMLNQVQLKRQKRQHSSPKTLDFSKFLDSSTFKFTPLKPKSPKNEESELHFFSPPKIEAKISSVETKTALRKETYVTVPKFLKPPDLDNSVNNEFEDSLSPKSPRVNKQSEMSVLFNDIKFTPFKGTKSTEEPFSPKCCSTSRKSIKSPVPFNDDPAVDKTFEITSTSQNNTFELPKSPTSRGNSLKPLCLAREFDNVEFTVSHARCSNQFSASQIDRGSAQDCLQADLWVKNTSLSPRNLLHSTTLESIKEDVCDNQRTKKSNPLCIEISPPKKKSVVRKISPTKIGSRGGKVLKEKPVTRVLKKKMYNTSIKGDTVMIPGVKIAKLSLSKLNSSNDESNLKKVKKQSKEPSVKLHDPNDFLTMFCNPDPFAATMTQDPFLASTLYYDDKWIFIQELEFKKWLNALLTPPEHLSADVESSTIDVGKVWQSCRGKESVVLAETKEAISARYHTNTRLNTLRKAACSLFRKPEMIGPLSQTTVGIEKEILVIRPDKDLHRDIGLQKIILELFISYNPLWLRIGLETIYGETIPLQSNNDLIGLSRFLLNRFFSDPFIVKQHSVSSHPNIRLATFQPTINKFMLKKFLFLVYFLDYAKRMKLIGHDPCLFHKKALIKDSRSILLTFSRELLSGIGDVTKVLRNYGYAVSHKQTYLDEYDYALTNLCTDLRDGVRLCRVMELITGNRCLTCRCRVPAISRLQKVHNVSIALDALSQAGYTITGGIDAKCIADGHREKTLSLLWQIIYRFQRPRFERAASTVQRWWRSRMWLPRLRRLIAQRRHEAACTIQRAWRCCQARRQLADLRCERELELRRRHEAALTLQRHWRLRQCGRQQRRDYLLRRAATLRLQTWWRRVRVTRPLMRDLARRRRLIIGLQRRWRALLERQRYLRLRRYATLVQARWRFVRLRQAALRLQAWWRARLLGRRQRSNYLQLRRSVLTVQQRWRALREARLHRGRFLKLRHACLAVQARWRFLRQRHAALKLQAWWKARLLGRRQRSNYLQLRRSVLTVQQRWRALREARIHRGRFLKLRHACLAVQARWRFLRQRHAALRLQAWWRARLLGRRQRRDYLQLRRCVLVVQQRWRAQREARFQHRRFISLRSSCLAVQARWRFLRRRQAALRLQSWWRARTLGRRQHHDYIQLRRCAIVVQQRWRAQHEARLQRQRFLALRSACLTVQARWRFLRLRRAVQLVKRTLLARRARLDYLRLRSATLLLQARWRARREERRCRAAATRIQTFWRGWRARRHYLSLRRACLTVQARWRFTRLRRAAVLVQSRWRAQRQRRLYLRQRAAAIVVQDRWRRMLCQRRLARLRWAVRLVELRREAMLAGKRARLDFLLLKQTTVKLQRRHRARRCERAATTLQRWWRALMFKHRLRAALERRRRAVRLIESWWTDTAEQREKRAQERLLTWAAVKIQSAWRGFVVRRAASQRLAELRSRADRAAKAAVPTATLGFRLQDNIEKFRYAQNIGQLSVSLASLDVLVRLLPNACIEVCQLNLVSKIYEILTLANRSLPWLDVCLKDVSILLTLAKFKPTTEYVLKPEYVEVLARILTISSDKKEDLFLHTATLMWVLTDNSEYAEAAKNCPRTKYLLQSLYTSMNKKLGKSVGSRCAQDVLPSPNPDWGLKNKRPRTFTSVSQAVTSLASRLNILNIANIDMQRSFNFSM